MKFGIIRRIVPPTSKLDEDVLKDIKNVADKVVKTRERASLKPPAEGTSIWILKTWIDIFACMGLAWAFVHY